MYNIFVFSSTSDNKVGFCQKLEKAIIFIVEVTTYQYNTGIPLFRALHCCVHNCKCRITIIVMISLLTVMIIYLLLLTKCVLSSTAVSLRSTSNESFIHTKVLYVYYIDY